MARYTDELEPVVERERALRRAIALALAEEAGRPGEAPEEAVRAAIDAWRDGGEEDSDPAAFRPLSPLQRLLAEHRAVAERIDDMLDRRLS